MDTGNFWGIAPTVYNLFESPKTIEGFASVFNHNLNNYYSLLPELENSQGEFFKNFLDDDRYTDYILNPPFTENVINKMFDLVYEKIYNSKNPIYVLIYIPTWKDIINEKMKLFDKMVTYKEDGQTRAWNYLTNSHINTRLFITLIYISNDKSKLDLYKRDFFNNIFTKTNRGKYVN